METKLNYVCQAVTKIVPIYVQIAILGEKPIRLTLRPNVLPKIPTIKIIITLLLSNVTINLLVYT